MDYEKAYKEALERAEKLATDLPNGRNDRLYHVDDLEYIFPVLKKGEDERIRKFLHHTFTAQYLCKDKLGTWHREPVTNILAWLEKKAEQKFTQMDVDDAYLKGICDAKHELEKQDEQTEKMKKEIAEFIFNSREIIKHRHDWIKCLGYDVKFLEDEKKDEQKPADKVKFIAGNWYQCVKNFFGKGVHFDKDVAYYCAIDKCLQNEYGCHISIVDALYDNFRLWNVKDAKEGDVLADDEGFIMLVDESRDSKFGYRLSRHCAVLSDGEFTTVNVHTRVDGLHPATKEQRDQLEKAMADAGYTFDFEKKELKKIEQKPVEWSEEDEKNFINAIINSLDKDKLNRVWGISFEEVKSWLQSLRPQKQWKPSDEQLKTLEKWLEDNRYKGDARFVYPIFKSLYEQLKALKEE